MIHSWSELDVQGRARFRAATAFLEGRLAEPETVDWALRLRPDRQIERTAIFELVSGPGAQRLREPYATAWPLILESWSYRTPEGFPASTLQQLRRRLLWGDRSGRLIDEIADLVAPRLEAKPPQVGSWLSDRKPRRPKKFSDLLSASLTSASLLFGFHNHRIDLGVEEITDAAFLHALASALISAIDRGLYIARRVYGDNESDWHADAAPLRVYFVPPEIGVHDRDGPGGRVFEPDAATRGMGPAVKLLDAVLHRIATLDARTARLILGRWRYSDMAIYRRLWAAAARDAKTVAAAEVGEFLTALDDSDFWNFPSLPEFAELRAVRFRDFEPDTQAAIANRLRKGLPCKYFPNNLDAGEICTARRGFSAMELRRIETAGGVLPALERDWLLEAIDEFPGLQKMTVDRGFRDPWVRPRFGPRAPRKTPLDHLVGEARLRALEDQLSGETSADRASDWLREPGRAVLILSDFQATNSRVDRFPHVWDRFGHLHSWSGSHAETDQQRDIRSEANRVLALMNRLSDATVEAAIHGICHWLYMWSEHVIGTEMGRQVWLRAWPAAVKVTNATDPGDDRGLSDPTVRTGDKGRKPEEIDAFHLPVGKLLRAFLELFQYTEEIRDPFRNGSLFTQMRDCAIAAPSRSGLIARCELTQRLSSFLQVDPAWAKQQLIEPLLKDNDETVVLWRAVASTWIDSEVLEIIGEEASRKVLDSRLGRDARKDLVSCLVVEGLRAFKDRHEPSVSQALISQTLRAAEDEIREWAALEVRQFQEYAFSKDQDPRALGNSFRSNIKPFLERVWPQERSLATGGESHHLACVPAVSGDAFVEAVHEIERFLIPFDCSSMLSYGFYEGDLSEEIGIPRLSDAIDDPQKARAFLRLLDLTIRDSETAVVPSDLGAALERIESLAPKLTSGPAFRRLAAAARR